MQTNLIVIISLAFVLMVTTGIMIFTRVYKNRQEKNRQEQNDKIANEGYSKPNSLIKRALLLEDSVILVGDHEMVYELSMFLSPADPVYIKYYNEYKPMLVLMYKHDVGYVLVSQDEEGEPKFYPYYKVFVAIPRQDFVTGHIRTIEGEEDVFVINGLAPREEERIDLREI